CHGGAPGDTGGGLHGVRPDRVVADVLRDLQREGGAALAGRDVDMHRVVDVGHLISRELNVHDRADDPGNAASELALGLAGGGCVFCGCGHDDAHLLPLIVSASALAPPTISLISCVISACLALLASLVSASSSSLALSVADFIARRRAAISAAAESSSAWKIRLSTYHGNSASSTCC